MSDRFRLAAHAYRTYGVIYWIGGFYLIWHGVGVRGGRIVESGVVWINQIHVLSPKVPMGGMKQSGFGIENGLLGLSHYCNLQTVVQKRDD